MDQGYYLRHAQRATEFMDDALRNKVSWLQHVLLLSSAVLGLLAGLQSITEAPLSVRVVFVLTISLLAAGTALGGVALYGNQVFLSQARRQGYIDAVAVAIQKGSEVEPVFGALPKMYERCEKACYIVLVLSVVSLVAYSVMGIF